MWMLSLCDSLSCSLKTLLYCAQPPSCDNVRWYNALLSQEFSPFHLKEALTASLWHILDASITALCFGAIVQVVFEQKHCDPTPDGYWVTYGQEWTQYGYTGQRHDSHPGQDEVGQPRFYHSTQNSMPFKTKELCVFVFLESFCLIFSYLG